MPETWFLNIFQELTKRIWIMEGKCTIVDAPTKMEDGKCGMNLLSVVGFPFSFYCDDGTWNENFKRVILG